MLSLMLLGLLLLLMLLSSGGIFLALCLDATGAVNEEEREIVR